MECLRCVSVERKEISIQLCMRWCEDSSHFAAGSILSFEFLVIGKSGNLTEQQQKTNQSIICSRSNDDQQTWKWSMSKWNTCVAPLLMPLTMMMMTLGAWPAYSHLKRYLGYNFDVACGVFHSTNCAVVVFSSLPKAESSFSFLQFFSTASSQFSLIISVLSN